jgi:heme/copper-type cytochrome/quinol oxidase subunit 3
MMDIGIEIVIPFLASFAAASCFFYSRRHTNKSVLIISGVAFILVACSYFSPFFAVYLMFSSSNPNEDIEAVLGGVELASSVMLVVSYLLLTISIVKLGRSRRNT